MRCFRCSNTPDPKSGIILHKIPYDGNSRPEAINRRKRWVNFVKRKHTKLEPSSSSWIYLKQLEAGRICSPSKFAGANVWKAILDKSGREFSRTVENFLGRSRIFSDGREFSRTVENFLGRSRIFSDGREFSRTVENFLARSRIFSHGREFSGTVEIFLGRSRFFSDGRDFSRTVEIFLGRSRIFSDGRDFKFFSVGRDFPSNSPAFPSI